MNNIINSEPQKSCTVTIGFYIDLQHYSSDSNGINICQEQIQTIRHEYTEEVLNQENVPIYENKYHNFKKYAYRINNYAKIGPFYISQLLSSYEWNDIFTHVQQNNFSGTYYCIKKISNINLSQLNITESSVVITQQWYTNTNDKCSICKDDNFVGNKDQKKSFSINFILSIQQIQYQNINECRSIYINSFLPCVFGNNNLYEDLKQNFNLNNIDYRKNSNYFRLSRSRNFDQHDSNNQIYANGFSVENIHISGNYCNVSLNNCQITEIIELSNCKCFNYSFNYNICNVYRDLSTNDSKQDYLLTRYSYNIQKEDIEDNINSVLNLSGNYNKIVISNCSYDTVMINNCENITINNSYISNLWVNNVKDIKLLDICSQNLNLYNCYFLKFENSVFNQFHGYKLNHVFIQKSKIDIFSLIQFVELYLYFNFIKESQFYSFINKVQIIRIRFCELGKIKILSNFVGFDFNNYLQYLNGSSNNINYVYSSLIQFYQDFYCDQIINYQPHQLDNQLKKIDLIKNIDFNNLNIDFVNPTKYPIPFDMENCIFVDIYLSLKTFCTNVYNNIGVHQLENYSGQCSIVFDDFSSIYNLFGLNKVQYLRINKNDVLRHLDLNSNNEILKYVQLTNNKKLQSFEITNDNIVQSLIIKNCKLKKLNITPITFPKIKSVQISENEKQFDYEKYVYRNEIVFNHQRITQNKMGKSNFYDLVVRLQYSKNYNYVDGFIYKILFNDCVVFIKWYDYKTLLNLFHSKNNNQTELIKIYKCSTIQQIEISYDIDFTKLVIQDTDIQGLILKGNQLEYLDVSYNKLNNLQSTNEMAKLKYFNVSNNNLTKFYNGNKINIIINGKIQYFNIYNNDIKKELFLNDNVIENININKNKHLESINLNNNCLSNFTAHDTNLKIVYIDNQHKIIEIKQNNQTSKITQYTLKTFNCSNIDYISALGNQELETFISENGKLDHFKIYQNNLIYGKLQYINVSNSGLKSLYVNNCPNLYYLNVNNCTGIDLRFSNKNLKQLYCYNVGLEQLNLKDSKIRILDASFNKLTSITLPITITELNLNNNQLYSLDLSYNNPNSIVSLNNNKLKFVKITNANNISSFKTDYIQNLYLLGNQANDFLQKNAIDNINKISFCNKNKNIQLRDKNIQNIQLYCTQNVDNDDKDPQRLFVQNCNIANCKITSVNNIDNKNGFILNINYSKLSKLIIDYSYITQINLLDNYVSKIIIAKALKKINNINIVQSNGHLDIQLFLNDLYNRLQCNSGGQINISSYKFNPYYNSTQNLIQKFQNKNWKINFN